MNRVVRSCHWARMCRAMNPRAAVTTVSLKPMRGSCMSKGWGYWQKAFRGRFEVHAGHVHKGDAVTVFGRPGPVISNATAISEIQTMITGRKVMREGILKKRMNGTSTTTYGRMVRTTGSNNDHQVGSRVQSG